MQRGSRPLSWARSRHTFPRPPSCSSILAQRTEALRLRHRACAATYCTSQATAVLEQASQRRRWWSFVSRSPKQPCGQPQFDMEDGSTPVQGFVRACHQMWQDLTFAWHCGCQDVSLAVYQSMLAMPLLGGLLQRQHELEEQQAWYQAQQAAGQQRRAAGKKHWWSRRRHEVRETCTATPCSPQQPWASAWNPMQWFCMCLGAGAVLLAQWCAKQWWAEEVRRQELRELLEANARAKELMKQRYQAALAVTVAKAAKQAAQEEQSAASVSTSTTSTLPPRFSSSGGASKRKGVWTQLRGPKGLGPMDDPSPVDDEVAKEYERFLVTSKCNQVSDVFDVHTTADNSPKMSLQQLEEITQRFRNANKNSDGTEKPLVTFDDLYGGPVLEIKRKKKPPPPPEAGVDEVQEGGSGVLRAVAERDSVAVVAEDQGRARAGCSRRGTTGAGDEAGDEQGAGGEAQGAPVQAVAQVSPRPPAEETMEQRAARRRARLSKHFMTDEEMAHMF